MDRERIRTVNDLIMAVCESIRCEDMEMIEAAEGVVRDWMIDDDTRIAVNTLVDTAIDVISSQ